jgi:hypothetical protein
MYFFLSLLVLPVCTIILSSTWIQLCLKIWFLGHMVLLMFHYCTFIFLLMNFFVVLFCKSHGTSSSVFVLLVCVTLYFSDIWMFVWFCGDQGEGGLEGSPQHYVWLLILFIRVYILWLIMYCWEIVSSTHLFIKHVLLCYVCLIR